MKTLSRTALTALLLLLGSIAAQAAPQRGKKQTTKPRPVNIRTVVNSALIMADDYATALTQKPEFAQTRLNILTDYYNTLPTDAVRDSVRSRIFDFYVNYVETGKTGQADAFKQSFLAIAPDTDEHLGPLYANELIVAQENFDTTKVKSELSLLENYAEKMNVDYDEVIHHAQDFLHFMRTKSPIQKALMGVWVGEGIYKEYDYDYIITPLREAHHIIAISKDMIMSAYPECDFITHYLNSFYTSPYDCIANPLFQKAKVKGLDIQGYPRHQIYFEDLRGAYCLYSDQNIESFDPEYFAKVRQNMQNQVARAHGELARNKSSFGKNLGVSVASNGLLTVGNSIIDRLAVSKANYWHKELNLHLVSPVKMIVSSFFQYNTVKSNSSYVHKLVTEEPNYEYYKWLPADEIFFIDENGRHLFIGSNSKEKKKERKNIVNEYQKEYKSRGNSLKITVNSYRRFYNYFNKIMFNKLKALREKEL